MVLPDWLEECIISPLWQLEQIAESPIPEFFYEKSSLEDLKPKTQNMIHHTGCV